MKVRLKLWLDEAYSVTTSIEGKLANLQATQQKLQPDSLGLATEKLVEEVKQEAA